MYPLATRQDAPKGRESSRPVVYRAGEADVAEREVLEAIAQGQARVAVDLDRLEGLDTAALRGLITLLRSSRRAGGEVVLQTSRGDVRRGLRLTALDRLFTIEGAVEEAAA